MYKSSCPTLHAHTGSLKLEGNTVDHIDMIMIKQLSACVTNISPLAARAGYFLRLPCLPSDAGTFLLPVCPPKEWKAFFRKSGSNNAPREKTGSTCRICASATAPGWIRLQQSGFNDAGIIHKLFKQYKTKECIHTLIVPSLSLAQT